MSVIQLEDKDYKIIAQDSKLRFSSFTDCLLGEVKFIDSSFQNSQFRECSFKDTVFSEVDLSGVAISDCKYEGMTIEGIAVSSLIGAYKEKMGI